MRTMLSGRAASVARPPRGVLGQHARPARNAPFAWALSSACALLAGCGAAVATQGLSSVGTSVNERYLTAATTHADDKLAGLLGDLNQRVASRPEDAIAWRDLGITQARLGIYKDARNALDRAVGSLQFDPYLASYRGLTLEMLGESESAALEFERAAGLLPGFATRLKARAGLVRVRAGLRAADPAASAATSAVATGATSVALLAAVDLAPPASGAAGGAQAASGASVAGGTAAASGASGAGAPVSAAEALAAALQLGLSASPGVTVLSPAESDAFLAADKHAAKDFDDAQARTAAAKGLAKRGIARALTCSFLVIEDGSMHVRVALLPLTSAGAGDPVAPALEPGVKGSELLPLAACLPELWRAAGQPAASGEPGSWMPTSLDGARAYAAGMRAFRVGEYAAAQAALTKAAAAAPGVIALGRWRDAAAAVAPYASDPLVSSAGEPRGLVEALRNHAQLEKRKLDEQLGPSDVPF